MRIYLKNLGFVETNSYFSYYNIKVIYIMEMKKLRQQLNKSQKEVAEELNIARTKYARYETGESNPDVDMLIKLADYFHTTVDHLIGHEVPYLINKSEFSSNQLSIIEEIKQLSNEDCGKLLSYIAGLKDGKQ